MEKTSELDKAKAEIVDILWEQAKDADDCLISYSTLAERITSIEIQAYNQVLWSLLGDISTETFESDGVMLSALVVESSSNVPGAGFWVLAHSLGALSTGSTTMENMTFWVEQVKKIVDLSSSKQGG